MCHQFDIIPRRRHEPCWNPGDASYGPRPVLACLEWVAIVGALGALLWL